MQNPHQNIPKACKRVITRVIFFHLLAVLVVVLVPKNYPQLSNGSGTAAQSQFIIIVVDADIKVILPIINAIDLSSVWLTSNQNILTKTQTIYGLVLKGL